jgi:hypothetical protein
MSVRKRTWANSDGSQGEAWIAEYTDFDGKRRIRTFDKKRDADAFHASVAGELRSGPRQPERHRRGSRAAVAARLRGGRAGTIDDRCLPAAP